MDDYWPSGKSAIWNGYSYSASKLMNYSSAHSRQKTIIIQSRQIVELLQSGKHCFCRRRVHKIKLQQIVDAHCLELKQRSSQISALNLRNWRWNHLISKQTNVKVTNMNAYLNARSVYNR